jgi:uncharacterized protein Smg (DUF494 family)
LAVVVPESREHTAQITGETAGPLLFVVQPNILAVVPQVLVLERVLEVPVVVLEAEETIIVRVEQTRVAVEVLL